MAHIRTYARLKPSLVPYENYEILNNCLQIQVPDVYRDYGPSPGKFRSSISYAFKFDNVFNASASQEEVFNAVAYDIIEGFLNGYNGTIFAYGQTGTGKTYTVEGSARKYSERGLAPRALSMIYKALEKRQDEEITAHISYIEIYQEVAYDLLTAGARSFSTASPFPKVTVVEGPGGTCMIRNLSVHLAASEDVAQSLLLQGEANRRVAETPVNLRSSRSHAVLTIHLAAKQPDSDLIIRSKLHLVDLAGSERVAKTGVDGHQLTEAKSINLSLHHLETVIISLQTDSLANSRLQQKINGSQRSLSSSGLYQSRSYTGDGFRATRHVPYRNSLLTMVLRDSLGGNCQTAMIATLSLEWKNLGETLSTCRFAQRVACIANHAIRNEEVDDRTLIRRLKKRISELESEISCFKLSQEESNIEPAMAGKLTDEDKLHCSKIVHEFLGGRLADPISAGITSPYKFRECFKVLKTMVMKGYFNPQTLSEIHTNAVCGDSPNPTCDEHGMQMLKQNQNNTSDSGDVKSNGFPVKPVQAWTDSSVSQHQNLNATYTVNSEHPNRSSEPHASSHSPQRSEHFRSPKRETYKSPFERKRQKEINRLSQKLNNMEDTRVSKEQKLADLRYQVALQELETIESGIQAKLDVTVEQVNDQHAYVLQLKHTEATADLLNQEKLVERQLKKRQIKFENKLEEIRERKALILTKSSDEENVEPPRSPQKPRMDEKYAQCKKRDGSLNTRQVFEMLKTEEKKQTKVQAQIEREHIITVTRQLEVKEAATRLKLRELKEMFRKSKDDEAGKMSSKGSSLTPTKMDTDNIYSRMSPSYKSATEEDNASHYSMFGSRQLDKALSSVNEDTRLVTHGGLSSDPFSIHPTIEEKPSDAFSIHPTMERKPSDAFSIHPTMEGKPSDVFSIHPTMEGKPSDVFSIHPTIEGKPNRFYTKRKSENSLSSRWDSAYSTRPSTAATISRPDTADVFLPYQEESSKQTSSENCNILVLPNRSAKTSICDLDTRTEQDGYGLEVPVKKSSAETFIPSPYLNAARAEKEFVDHNDPTSKTFDGALSSMLNEGQRQLVYDNFATEYYNQFARPKKNKPKKLAPKKSSKSPSKNDNLDDTTKLMMTGGSETKNSPISSRLDKFLNDFEDYNGSERLSSSRKKSHHRKSKTCDPFQSKLDEFNSSAFSDEGREVRPKITALADADRERVYMSKAQIEKERVEKIRKARHAAEVIQRAWRRSHVKG